MLFTKDIEEKVKADFQASSATAFNLLQNAISKADHLQTDRVLRCIVFLAKGNLDELKKYIKLATLDPRDIMLAAEYDPGNDHFNHKRVRNFNHTFDKSTQDVGED